MSIITRFAVEMRKGWGTCVSFVCIMFLWNSLILFCFFPIFLLSLSLSLSLSLLHIAIHILSVSLQLRTQTPVRTRSERVCSCPISTKTGMCRKFLAKRHSIKFTWKSRAAACRYTVCVPACGGAAALDNTQCCGATLSQQRLQPHTAEANNVQEGAAFRLELF